MFFSRLKALTYICSFFFATAVGLVVGDAGAQGPMTMDSFLQEARLSAPVGEVPKASGWFGASVSVSGNTIVIGARGDDYNIGAAYVYTNTGGTWTETKLTASDGAGGDYFGGYVSIDGNTIVIGANGDDDNGSSSGSAYVFSNAGGTWTQTAKLTAYDGAGGDYFGGYVSIDGNTIVIGANGDDDRGSNSGSAYVFTNDSGTWTQTAKLTAYDGAGSDYFGSSVSIDGNTIVIGANRDDDKGSDSGSAYVYTNTGGTWTETKLTASDGAGNDSFGSSVSIDGNAIVIGANRDSDNGIFSGSAYVFTNAGGTWTQTAKLTASDGASFDSFGSSVSIDGNTIVIGAIYDEDNGSRSGSAYVFSNDSGTWTQTANLTASDGASFDSFGSSVSVDGNTIVIGAYRNDARGSGSGGAYVFVKPNTGWNDGTQDAKLSASDGVASVSKNIFGSSVSADGNTVVIGAYGEDHYKGSAYVFSNDSGTWTQMAKLTASDGAGSDYFGSSVSIDGNTIVIGAYRDDDNGSNSGSAYVFTNDSGTWTQMAKLTASDGAGSDYFGSSVSIDGNTIVIGAYRDDDNGSSSGSAYVFTNDSGTWTQTAKLTASDGAGSDYFGSSCVDRWKYHCHRS